MTVFRNSHLAALLGCLLPFAAQAADDAAASAPVAASAVASAPVLGTGYPRGRHLEFDADVALESDTQVAAGVTPGQKVWSPMKKVHLQAELLALPAPCDTKLLAEMVVAGGVDFSSLPKISSCLRIKTAKAHELSVFVQDDVAAALAKSSKPGDALQLNGVYVYASEVGKSLGVIVTGIGSDMAEKATQPGKAKVDKTSCLELKTYAEIVKCTREMDKRK
ncbi:MAG TPA: hypothetical protein VFR06_10290 [Gallionellaceae bacterium]|nr:hypothetical protein [Gallionellaceae bacterium]